MAEGEAATTVLWRPVGPVELELIRQACMRGFPARLPDQLVSYPVAGEAHAAKIARDWNVPADGSDFMTRFAVRSDVLARNPIRHAGGRDHAEHWIPAEESEVFSSAIAGQNAVVQSFSGRAGSKR